jgi:hypothetical protein
MMIAFVKLDFMFKILKIKIKWKFKSKVMKKIKN